MLANGRSLPLLGRGRYGLFSGRTTLRFRASERADRGVVIVLRNLELDPSFQVIGGELIVRAFGQSWRTPVPVVP